METYFPLASRFDFQSEHSRICFVLMVHKRPRVYATLRLKKDALMSHALIENSNFC